VAKGFSVWATLKGSDLASGPIVRGLGKIRVAGQATKHALSFGAGLLGVGGLTSVLSIAGAAEAVRRLVGEYAAATAEQSKFARQNKIGIGSLQEYQYVAGREGIGVDALKESITALEVRIGQTAAGRGRLLAFLKGIKGGDGAKKALLQTTDGIQALTVALNLIRRSQGVNNKLAMAKALGLDPSFVRLAAMSTEEIAALRSEMRGYGTDTEETGRNAERFREGQERVKGALEGLQRTLGAEFDVPITGYLNELATALAANRGNVKRWAKDVVEDTGYVRESFGYIADVASPFVKGAKWIFENPARMYHLVRHGRLGQETTYNESQDKIKNNLKRAGYSDKELSDARAQAQGQGLPVVNSNGQISWDIIKAVALQRRHGGRKTLDSRGAPEVLPVKPTETRPAFGNARTRVDVVVSDERVIAKASVVEGPVDVTTDVGTPAVFK
jgi:hypothetical protein